MRAPLTATQTFLPLRDLGGPQDVKDWKAAISARRRGGSGLAGCCSPGCDSGFDKALLMGCGKAFYQRSVLACMKGMNLNKHEAAHTRRRAKAGKRTCTHNPRLQHFSCIISQRTLGRFSVCPPPPLPSLSPPFCWCVPSSVSPFIPECKVRIIKGTPGTHGCGPPLLIVTLPSPTMPPHHSTPR